MNLFYIPYSLAFEYDYDKLGTGLDLISILIYGFDIFLSSRTVKFDNEQNRYIVDRNLIFLKYINEEFFMDIISFLPLDYILMAF